MKLETSKQMAINLSCQFENKNSPVYVVRHKPTKQYYVFTKLVLSRYIEPHTVIGKAVNGKWTDA